MEMVEKKFKIFDRKEKKMLGAISIEHIAYSPWHIENALYLQYSGFDIPDRKAERRYQAIELYEGDVIIINSPTGYFRNHCYGFESRNANGEMFYVVFVNGGFCLRHLGMLNYQHKELWDTNIVAYSGFAPILTQEVWNHKDSNFEYVGNIYTHPELWKEGI